MEHQACSTRLILELLEERGIHAHLLGVQFGQLLEQQFVCNAKHSDCADVICSFASLTDDTTKLSNFAFETVLWTKQHHEYGTTERPGGLHLEKNSTTVAH